MQQASEVLKQYFGYDSFKEGQQDVIQTILSGRDAKQVYTGVTAAALRGKDCVLKQVNVLQENAEDIYADALAINEERNAKAEEEIFEDISEEDEVSD